MSDVPGQEQVEYVAPPSEIAGVDAVDAEPVDGVAGPSVDVRGRVFAVRSGVPALLAEKLAKVQKGLPKIAEDTPWADLSESVQGRFLDAQAVSYDLLMATIPTGDRYEFEEYINGLDPVVEATELAQIMQRALEAASGRPTSPS